MAPSSSSSCCRCSPSFAVKGPAAVPASAGRWCPGFSMLWLLPTSFTEGVFISCCTLIALSQVLLPLVCSQSIPIILWRLFIISIIIISKEFVRAGATSSQLLLLLLPPG